MKQSSIKYIGLTGSIASGKSTVTDRLKKLGVRVYDADMEARDAVKAGSSGLERIRERFGDGVISSDGSLNRRALAAIIFSDEEARLDAERIIHPIVFASMYKKAELYAKRSRKKALVFDVPLLIEAGEHVNMDEVWLVMADDDTRIRRIMLRDGCTRDEAMSRIRSQMPQDEKKRFCDVIIDNSSDVETLYRQVDELYQTRIR